MNLIYCRICGGSYDADCNIIYHKYYNPRRVCRECFKKEVIGPKPPFRYREDELPFSTIESRFEILDL